MEMTFSMEVDLIIEIYSLPLHILGLLVLESDVRILGHWSERKSRVHTKSLVKEDYIWF